MINIRSLLIGIVIGIVISLVCWVMDNKLR